MQRSKRPSVSVIIPAYSRENLLLETLGSVTSQKGNFDLQIIVIDDNSPVALRSKINSKYPNIVVLRNSRNLKSGPTRNVGLKKVKTDYVCFLDADDIWKDAFLEKSIEKIEKNAGTMAFTVPLVSNDFSLKSKIKIYALLIIRELALTIFYIFNKQKLPKSAFYLCQVSHLMFRWDTVKELHFDSDYNFGGEDWKYALDVLMRGDIKIIPQRLVKYRYHPQSSIFKSENLRNKWKSYEQLFKEIKKYNIDGIMITLFRAYISVFSR